MILVFGSINIDLVSTVDRFPSAGETVRGEHFSVLPGGKGANQALAAARAGATVAMFGAVGEDAFADLALANLARAGVDLRGVSHIAAATGCATILVERGGENRIVIVPGANAHASADAVAPGRARRGCDACACSRKCPPPPISTWRSERGRPACAWCLNAAPARALSRECMQLIDVLDRQRGRSGGACARSGLAHRLGRFRAGGKIGARTDARHRGGRHARRAGSAMVRLAAGAARDRAAHRGDRYHRRRRRVCGNARRRAGRRRDSGRIAAACRRRRLAGLHAARRAVGDARCGSDRRAVAYSRAACAMTMV